MTKQSKSSESQTDKNKQPQKNVDTLQEGMGEQTALPALPGFVATPGDGSSDSQAARLRDPRWQTVQRQTLAAQIGRTQGNRHLQRLMRPAQPTASSTDHSTIQRARVEATAQGFKVTLDKEIKLGTIKSKYAKVEFKTAGAVETELKSKTELPANAGIEKTGDGATAKASVEVYKSEAKAAGTSAFAKLAYDSLEPNGWEVDKVDWENELGTEKKKTGDAVSIATGIKITFKNGQESVVKASLFEKAAGVGLDGPKLALEHTIKLVEKKLWENKSAELVVSGPVKLQAEVKPNWKQILADLAKKGGREVAKSFARSAMRGVVNFFLGAGSLVLGGVITIAATAATIQNAQEIKAVIRIAKKAVDSYTRGYCVSWGVTEYGSSGLKDWVKEGKAAGEQRLNDMIQTIQKHPVFAPWNFTKEELLPELQARLKNYGPEIWAQVHGEVKDKIYKEYVIQFYERRKSGFFTPTYIARNDARHVARVLGVPEDVIPEEE